MAIEPLVNYEIAELTRHFASIVGTPGMDERVLVACNENILKLVIALNSNVDQVVKNNSVFLQ